MHIGRVTEIADFVTVRIPRALWERIKVAAHDEHRSAAAQAIVLIEQALVPKKATIAE